MAFTYSLVSHTVLSTGSLGTTGGITTTGANLIVVGLSGHSGNNTTTLTDSLSNTWVLIPVPLGSTFDSTDSLSIQGFYCANPTVGVGHTFTVGTAGANIAMTVAAYSAGGALAGPQGAYSFKNTLTPAVTTFSAGYVVPDYDNSLVVALALWSATGTATIDSGFTITDANTAASGTIAGCGQAYLVQTTAAAASPTWTIPSGEGVSILCVFNPSQPASTGQNYHAIMTAMADNAQGLITAAQVRNALSSIQVAPNISRVRSFDNCVGQGMVPIVDYVFGSSAVATGTQIAITNQTQLSTYFSAFQDVAGIGPPRPSNSINSEMERYTSFNSTNHAFATDRLNLTAVIDTAGAGTYSGAFTTQVRKCIFAVVIDGTTSTTIAQLGWANTTGITVGQIVGFLFGGGVSAGYVKSIVVNTSVVFGPIDQAQTSFTLGSPNCLNVSTPFQWFTISALSPGTNPTTLTAAALPSGITAGMRVHTVQTQELMHTDADYRISSIATNTITLNTALLSAGSPNPTPAVGTFIICGPPITSGQIWSKQAFDFSGDRSVIGFDLWCSLPTDATNADTTTAGASVAAFNAISTSFPWGSWPTIWFYSSLSTGLTLFDNSEWDGMEIQYNASLGPFNYTSNLHCTPAATGIWSYGEPFWSNSNFGSTGAVKSIISLQGTQRFSGLKTSEYSYSYVNNLPVIQYRGTLATGVPMQLGVNLAIGSLAGLSTFLTPFATTNFAAMKFGIKRITIYRSLF